MVNSVDSFAQVQVEDLDSSVHFLYSFVQLQMDSGYFWVQALHFFFQVQEAVFLLLQSEYSFSPVEAAVFSLSDYYSFVFALSLLLNVL
jgi:hypothetical protein